MDEQKKSPFEYSIEELDRELIARGAQVPDEKKFNFNDRVGTPGRDAIMARTKKVYQAPPPLNEALSHISTWDLAKVLIFKTQPFSDFTRGEGSIEIIDWHEIPEEQVRKNTECVAAICLPDNLIDTNKSTSTLKVKNYGKTFNLCENEFFLDQPISSGHMSTGFLVKDDVVATVGHFSVEHPVTDLRFIFGYKMVDSSMPVTEFTKNNIYSGLEIIYRSSPQMNNNTEWMLIKLDRKVVGWETPTLSQDEIYGDQLVYTLGYPLGLPLKYASGASVLENITETIFLADLNTYSGCPGAPVFDMNTNEVIGMILKEVCCDFRWTGKGWLSVQKPDGPGIDCIKISVIKDILQKL